MEIRNSLQNESRIDGIKHDSYRIAYLGKMFPFLNAVSKTTIHHLYFYEPKKLHLTSLLRCKIKLRLFGNIRHENLTLISIIVYMYMQTCILSSKYCKKWREKKSVRY